MIPINFSLLQLSNRAPEIGGGQERVIAFFQRSLVFGTEMGKSDTIQM